MYPNEPIITVVAPLIDAQLIETALLAQVNHQSLIATKTRRIVSAAEGRAVSLIFGARRAHNMDAAVYGARPHISVAQSERQPCLPVRCLISRSAEPWRIAGLCIIRMSLRHLNIMRRITRMERYFLVDTYDVIGSGIPNAIRVAKEVLEPMGKRLKGIRIDSGDLAYLSKKSVRC